MANTKIDSDLSLEKQLLGERLFSKIESAQESSEYGAATFEIRK